MPLNVNFQSGHTEVSCSGEGKADVASGLATDAVSPLYNGLSVLTKYFGSLTTDGDIFKGAYLNECQEAPKEELNSQSVNTAGIQTHSESSAYRDEASGEDIDYVSSFVRCVGGDPVAFKWGRHTAELGERPDQCKDVVALKKQPVKVTEERDALVLEARSNKAVTETRRHEKDALEAELEKIRARYEEDVTQLKDQLLFARAEREDQDIRVQRISEDMEAVLEEKSVLELKLEKFRARYKEDVMQLKDQLHVVKTQRGEQDVLVIRAERISEDMEAVKEEMGAVELELETVRARYKEDVIQLKDQLHSARTERDEQDLRAQRIAEDLEAVKDEKAALDVELVNIRARYKKEVSQLKEQLHTARTQRDEQDLRAQRIAEDMDAVLEDNGVLHLELEGVRARYEEDITQLKDQLNVLRAQRMNENIEAVKEQKGTLQLELDNFPGECMDAGLLAKELNSVRAERDRIRKERDALKLKAENSRHHSELLEGKLDVATAECEMQTDRNCCEYLERHSGVKCDSIMKERDVLRCEVEKLRNKCRDVPMLKMQLTILRSECDKFRKQRDSYVRE